MKIRVDLSVLLDSTLNGHLTFRNQNTEVVKGWIKKIYGIDKDNEIVINSAEFIPEGTLVKLNFDTNFDQYNPYLIQITSVSTCMSQGELKDGKLERVIPAKIDSFVYMNHMFKLDEYKDNWTIIDAEGHKIAVYDRYNNIFDVLVFMHDLYEEWLCSEKVKC